MVDYKYKDLFLKSHVDKQLRIAADDGLFTATNPDINWENFELTESLCSESELRFGSCEASMVKFQIRNAFIPLAGKWLTVTETLDGNADVPFQYGRYKVFSDVPTADKEYRDITAYDAMYDILNTDMAAWYNSVLPNENSTVTLRQFRTSFIRHFGLTEVVPEGGLVNDSMVVERTIQPEQISGKDIITAICEINGCFGHIGRDGKFHFIYLPQNIHGIYPANFLYPDHVPAQWDYLPQAETGHLYPQDPKGERMGAGRYKKCQYEDYVVWQINKLRIRQEENDIGATFPDTEPSDKDNAYIVEDNFLVYGKSAAELKTIAQNLYGKIAGIVYRPFNADCIGNPCMEVGDPLNLMTKYEIVESYIFVRKLKGIQGLNDNYSSKGGAKRLENVNSVQKSIIQLKGRTNTLVRNIEETRLEMKDIEKDLRSTISITASEIRTEIVNTATGLQSQITQNANEIELRVTKDGVVSAINLSPETVTIKANKIDLQGLVTATEFTSKFATVSTLNATTANLNNVIAQKATITDLNATNLRVQNLEIDRITASQVEAQYATITSLNSVNAKFSNLNASNITAGTLSVNRLNVSAIVSSMSAYNMTIKDLNANAIYTDVINIRGVNGIFWLGRRVAAKEISGSTCLVLD